MKARGKNLCQPLTSSALVFLRCPFHFDQNWNQKGTEEATSVKMTVKHPPPSKMAAKRLFSYNKNNFKRSVSTFQELWNEPRASSNLKCDYPRKSANSQ